MGLAIDKKDVSLKLRKDTDRKGLFWLNVSTLLSMILDMRFAVWSLDLAFHGFSFFKHSFWCKCAHVLRITQAIV